jgi:hypothetical protein
VCFGGEREIFFGFVSDRFKSILGPQEPRALPELFGVGCVMRRAS